MGPGDMFATGRQLTTLHHRTKNWLRAVNRGGSPLDPIEDIIPFRLFPPGYAAELGLNGGMRISYQPPGPNISPNIPVGSPGRTTYECPQVPTADFESLVFEIEYKSSGITGIMKGKKWPGTQGPTLNDEQLADSRDPERYTGADRIMFDEAKVLGYAVGMLFRQN